MMRMILILITKERRTMKYEQTEKCGGSLAEELAEMEKLLSRSEEQDLYAVTHTVGCTSFLTIYCC